MSLAVITFTAGDRATLLERCKDSVANSLPKGATHHVIETKGWHCYAKARVDALSLADYYTIVDDDDVVVNDSINKCFDAIRSTNAGISFADEALVDIDGKITATREGPRTYEDVKKHPWMIHGLIIVDVSAIKHDPRCLYGRMHGIEKWLSSSAMSAKGAIHVPVIGYHWTQHEGNMSKLGGRIKLPNITHNYTGTIPQYLV